MAEIRKFNPSNGEGIQKLVREALGETTRPVTPGEPQQAADDAVEQDDKVDEAGASDYLTYDTGSAGSGGVSGGSW